MQGHGEGRPPQRFTGRGKKAPTANPNPAKHVLKTNIHVGSSFRTTFEKEGLEGS